MIFCEFMLKPKFLQQNHLVLYQKINVNHIVYFPDDISNKLCIVLRNNERTHNQTNHPNHRRNRRHWQSARRTLFNQRMAKSACSPHFYRPPLVDRRKHNRSYPFHRRQLLSSQSRRARERRVHRHVAARETDYANRSADPQRGDRLRWARPRSARRQYPSTY